jgi:hypothetical protein
MFYLNACVVNRVNKNDDVIDTETAIATYKNFIYKQINIEHNRKNVVGVILTAGFSEFGTDKPLTEEEAKAMTGPFNITLGGVVWRVVNDDLANAIEESNDPTSDKYLSISASWELGFTGYSVVLLPEGRKNIEAGKTISTAAEVEVYKSNLRALGGSGKVEDKRIYRMPKVDVTPLGIGLTEAPAAEVKGVAVDNKESKAEVKEEAKSEEKPKEEVSEQNKISHDSNSNVNKERISNMKITSIKDITDENLKQVNASAISDFISSEFVAKDKEWQAEKSKLDNQLAEAEANHKKLLDEHTKIQESLKQLQATVEQFNKEKAEREAVEKFNARMSEVTEAYELDDEVRATIVEEVKAIASDEDFGKWKKKASVLLKGFAKKAPPFGKEGEKKEGEKSEEGCKCKEKHSGACKALDNAKKEKGALPNSSSASEPTLKEKYNGAFAKENFVIKF